MHETQEMMQHNVMQYFLKKASPKLENNILNYGSMKWRGVEMRF